MTARRWPTSVGICIWRFFHCSCVTPWPCNWLRRWCYRLLTSTTCNSFWCCCSGFILCSTLWFIKLTPPWHYFYHFPLFFFGLSLFFSALFVHDRFRIGFSALGFHLARKSVKWPAMPVSNKKQEFDQRAKTNPTVRWFLSACVPIRFCPRGAGRGHSRWNSRFPHNFRHFGWTA